MNTQSAETDLLPIRLARLVDVYGNENVAKLLGISRSQPARWRSGKQTPGLDRRRLIYQLDDITQRLLTVFSRPVAAVWLQSHNPLLRTRPIDALRLRGPLALEAAIAYEEQQAIG